MIARPPVSVVVPFYGTPVDSERLLGFLGELELGSSDELIVVDNCPQPVVPRQGPARVIRAPEIQSSYHARNRGAEAARSEWLLFIDSDTRPRPTILDDYFAAPIRDDYGIIAGEIVGAPEQRALTARYARSRGHLAPRHTLSRRPGPAAGTANALIRRRVWEELGGFVEVRSGADLEFSWRAQERGWAVGYSPDARVDHLHPEGLGATLRKASRYGPGQAWSNRRYPGSAPRPALLRELCRSLAGIVVWSVALRFERALFKALDGAWVASYSRGYYLGDNRARSRRMDQAAAVDAPIVVVASFPDAATLEEVETLISAARDRSIRAIVALRRPRTLDRRGVSTPVPTEYLEDASPARRLTALVVLLIRHPLSAARCLLASRAWPATTALLVRELRRYRPARIASLGTIQLPLPMIARLASGRIDKLAVR